MGRSALNISLGAILLIAAVAGFIIVPEHAATVTYFDPAVPQAACGPPNQGIAQAPGCTTVHSGVSHTAYDLLRVATWAVLIIGVLLAIVGLIHYARADRGQLPPSPRTS